MIQYKYSLDKSSKKFLCPKCNKRTFVKYIDNQTNSYLNDVLGRCDREKNCGYHSRPSGTISTLEPVYIPPKETSFHSYSLVTESGRNFKQNNFIQFLKTLFDENQIKEAILKYLIGTSKHWSGATVFWQFDNFEKVRHGKIMLFNSETGKRYKNAEGYAYISSVRSVLKLNDFNLNQCLFGLHLINTINIKTVALVEAEKTAIIMSIFKPEYIWLATGSKSGFKEEYLKPIKEFKIVAFPDKGEYIDWLNKAIQLNAFGYKITVNDWLENQSYPDGSDFADVYIDEQKNSNTQKMNYTNTELIVHKIEAKNPDIRYLIDVFGLVDLHGNEIRKSAS